MQAIDIVQATQRLPELIDLTMTGNDIVITRSGQPVVKLVSVAKMKRQRQFGSAKGLIKIADDFDEPLEDLQEYQ